MIKFQKKAALSALLPLTLSITSMYVRSLSAMSSLSLPWADSYIYLYRVSYLFSTGHHSPIALPDYPYGFDYILLIIYSLGIDAITLIKWFGPFFSALITLSLYCATKKLSNAKVAFFFTLLTCFPGPLEHLNIRVSLTRAEDISIFFTLLVFIVIFDEYLLRFPQLMVLFAVSTLLFHPLLGYLYGFLAIIMYLMTKRQRLRYINRFPRYLIVLLFAPSVYYVYITITAHFIGFFSYGAATPKIWLDRLLPDRSVAELVLFAILMAFTREGRQDFKQVFTVTLWAFLFLFLLLVPYIFSYASVVDYASRLFVLYEITLILLISKGFYEVGKKLKANRALFYLKIKLSFKSSTKYNAKGYMSRLVNLPSSLVIVLLMLIVSTFAYNSLLSVTGAPTMHKYYISDEDFRAYLWLAGYVNSNEHNDFVIIVVTNNPGYIEVRRLLFNSLLINRSYSYYEMTSIPTTEYIISESSGGKYIILSSELSKDMIEKLSNFLFENSFTLIYEREVKIFYGKT